MCRLSDVAGDKSHQILVKVSDNGSGVAAKDLDKIFIPFFTTKSSGAGLGLAIVQKIILMHDGKIEVESAPGKGTCFNIFL